MTEYAMRATPGEVLFEWKVLFEHLTNEELSRLMDLLFEAEAKFGQVYGPQSLQAQEMHRLLWTLPTFEYVSGVL
jgi:hypothetical protein